MACVALSHHQPCHVRTCDFQAALLVAQGQPAPLTPPSNQCPAQWQQMVSCLSDGKGLCPNHRMWSAFSTVPVYIYFMVKIMLVQANKLIIFVQVKITRIITIQRIIQTEII